MAKEKAKKSVEKEGMILDDENKLRNQDLD